MPATSRRERVAGKLACKGMQLSGNANVACTDVVIIRVGELLVLPSPSRRLVVSQAAVCDSQPFVAVSELCYAPQPS